MSDRAKTAMTRERVAALLEAYGGGPARWPDAERDAAQEFLARDAEATQLVAAELALDALLEHAPVQRASAALQARVAEIPIREARGAGRQSVRSLFGLRVWQMVAGGALAGMLGVLSGVWTSDETTGATSTAGGSSDDGWDDVASVAFANNPGEDL